MKGKFITMNDLLVWKSSDRWHTFASSTVESKKLQFFIGDRIIRVLHGSEIVYEGYTEETALEVYNAITGQPKNEPKISN